MIALIDVPPGFAQGRPSAGVRLRQCWCAAYHPWLAPLRAFDGTTPRPLPPSAIAAGIVARRELAFGVQAGPANEIAAEIVDLGTSPCRSSPTSFTRRA